MATVGSRPTRRTSPARSSSILLIVLGVGTLFYALVTVTEFFVAGHLGEILEERRTLNKIEDPPTTHRSAASVASGGRWRAICRPASVSS